MNFTGAWNIDGTDETLTISDQFASDKYLFEFSDENKTDEKVLIFLSTKKYARLANSKIYGRADIFIINADTFLIDDQKFIRCRAANN